jgi:phosphoglucosamine mutase
MAETTRKLFGTDGVRGPVGEQITPELALSLGRAATEVSRAGGTERPQVLILRDTRDSGPMLEAALAAGVAAAGGDAWLGGILPSAAASVLVRRHNLDLGAVVSASHNPWSDNGIKFFSTYGVKLDDEAEAEIEAVDIDQMIDARNERRRRAGRPEIGDELERRIRGGS